MMELSIDTLINIASLLLGGGGGAFFVWRWQQKKAKAEAQQAEVDMAQKVQDTYQEMLKDKEEQVAGKNRIIAELCEDRDHFRKDRNELRERMEKYEEEIRELKVTVDKNGRQIESLQRSICFNYSCKKRQLAEHIQPKPEPNEIEPNNEV